MSKVSLETLFKARDDKVYFSMQEAGFNSWSDSFNITGFFLSP